MMKKLALLVAVISSAYSGSALAFTTAEINTFVAKHNQYRLGHGSPPVQWSATVAQSAQAWADLCTYEHEDNIPYGENINMVWNATYTPSQVVDGWYDGEHHERAYYEQKSQNYTLNHPETQDEFHQDNFHSGDQQYAHFTQLVWKSNYLIGCGVKSCSDRQYWVCRYAYSQGGYKGNTPGQFINNVFSPRLRAYKQTIPDTYDLGASSWSNQRWDVWEAPYKYGGSYQSLSHRWWDGSLHNWETLGGTLTSAPAVVDWGRGVYHVFARGPNNTLIHKWIDGAGWHNWETIALGRPLASAPTVTSWGSGRLDVFAQGPYWVLMHWWYDGSGWHYEELGPSLLFKGAPAAISWGPGRIDLFAFAEPMLFLYHKWYDGAGWHDWEAFDDTSGSSSPTVTSWASGRLDVFFRGSDFRLYRKIFDGGWQTATPLLGSTQFVSSPATASWGSGRIDLFVRALDNNIVHYFLSNNQWYYEPEWAPSPF